MKQRFLSIVIFLFVFTAAHSGVSYFDVKRGFSSRQFFKSVTYYKDCERISADSIVRNKVAGFVPMQAAQQFININEQDCYYWILFTLINSSEKEQKIFFCNR